MTWFISANVIITWNQLNDFFFNFYLLEIDWFKWPLFFIENFLQMSLKTAANAWEGEFTSVSLTFFMGAVSDFHLKA